MEISYFDKIKMAEFSGNTAILRKIAEEDDPFIRAIVAQNGDTPLSLLDVLSKDAEDCVRLAVAENRCVSPKILDYLSLDKNQEIIQAIYLNRNTREETLRKIEEENEYLVKDLKYYREKISFSKDNPSYS
jgi:hypothetical protein